MTGMRLVVIGCSGSFAGPDSAASCYLLEAEDADGATWRILLDMGSGSLGPLQKYAAAEDVRGVFFSHLHPDHCLDLCGYYVLRKYHPGGALPRIPVWGPVGVAAADGRRLRPARSRHEQGVRLPRVRRTGRARPVPGRALRAWPTRCPPTPCG